MRFENFRNLRDVGAEVAHELNLLLLQVRGDDLALEQALERFEQLERHGDGGAVLEPLDDDRPEPTLELLHRPAKLVKVVVELLNLDVQDVVLQGVELLRRGLEIGENLLHRSGQHLTPRAPHLHALQLVELQHRLREVQDVVAPLQKRVQTREERGVLKLPRVLRRFLPGAALVREVLRLERAADAQRGLQFRHRFGGLDVEDLLRLHERARLRDEVVADFPHQHDDAPGRVVMAAVLPHQQNAVHDWPEQLRERGELVPERQLLEVRVERFQEPHVIVRLDARFADVLAQTLKRREVGGFRQLEHLDDFQDARAAQLLVDRVQVRGFVRPELQFRERTGVVPFLKRRLGVRLQDALDLACPGDHRRLQRVDLVGVRFRLRLLPGARRVGDGVSGNAVVLLAGRGALHRAAVAGPGAHPPRLRGGQREQRLAFGLADGHVHVGDELVQVLHHLLGDHLRPPDLVRGVGDHRQEHLVCQNGEVLQRHVAEVAVNHRLVDVVGAQLRLGQL